jgi:hypothetical protein
MGNRTVRVIRTMLLRFLHVFFLALLVVTCTHHVLKDKWVWKRPAPLPMRPVRPVEALSKDITVMYAFAPISTPSLIRQRVYRRRG